MDFLDRLKVIMESNQDNNSTLAKKSGIPYTTIVGLFKRGWETAQLSTIQKICDHYGVSLDYMVYGAEKLSPEALMVAAKYETISEYGKTVIDCILNQEGGYVIKKKLQIIEMADPSKLMVDYLHAKRQKEMDQMAENYENQLKEALEMLKNEE